MNVTFFELDDASMKPFERIATRHELRSTEARLCEDNADEFERTEICSIFINSRITEHVLNKLPSVKMITTRSSGVDHIDLGACAARNIQVCHVPGYGENAVAEHAFALLLTISHQMLGAAQRTKSGHFSPEGLIGFDLAGKKLGVIGAGAIGRRVIEIARGFNMQVIAHDPVAIQATEPGQMFSSAGLEEVLAAADIVSLHLPLTPHTKGMFSRDMFAKMKRGAILINTARGDLIDNEALIAALQSGELSAAGLDVIAGEQLLVEEAELVCPPDCARRDLAATSTARILLNMPNVVATPHSAFYTREAMQKIADTTIENIEAFIRGEPINLVSN